MLEWFASEFPPSPWVDLMRSALKAAGQRWERGLTEILDTQGELADWAYCIRLFRLALSILFTRASFREEVSGFEWKGRLDTLSEARSQLGLEKRDAFHELRNPDEDEERQEPNEPQDNQELRALRLELEQAKDQLRKAQAAKPEPVTSVKTELVYVTDPQVDQLKARVRELKQLVRKRNEERAGL